MKKFERRFKKLIVNPQILVDVLTEGFIVHSNLPEGTRYVSTQYDIEKDLYYIIVFNEKFPATKPGERIPEIDKLIISRPK